MFYSQNTAFIIGAGAHVPYNFPTGEELSKTLKRMHPKYPIKNLAKNEIDSIGALQERLNDYVIRAERLNIIPNKEVGESLDAYRGYIKDKMHSFIEKFGGANVPSIDTYLAKYIKEHKSDVDYPVIGKFLIASIIYDYEIDYPINFSDYDWIQFIIHNFLIDEKKRDMFFKQPPLIITFNYDNLFERFIYSHLVDFHHLDHDTSIELVKKLNILHVYGHTNSLELSSSDEVIKYSLKNLRVVGEERIDMDEISKKIQSYWRDIQHIYFLGFGFDVQNMNILFGKGRGGYSDYFKTLCSTSIGLSKFRKSKIRNEFKLPISFGQLEEQLNSLFLISERYPIFKNF